jgi:hypothetical protein
MNKIIFYLVELSNTDHWIVTPLCYIFSRYLYIQNIVIIIWNVHILLVTNQFWIHSYNLRRRRKSIAEIMTSTVYRALCRVGDRFVYPILPKFAQPAWNHAAGPKTVFFWAPTIKWFVSNWWQHESFVGV